MTPVSNNNDHHQPPTGNLEELFRQKFAEAELAPRADVWDRLDHELLLRENQGYRRRLVGYRRLAAAACAVATLGVGGWLSQHNWSGRTSADIAAVDSSAAARAAAARLGEAAQQLPASNATTAARSAANAAPGTARAAEQAATGEAQSSTAASAAVASTETGRAGSSILNTLRESFGAAKQPGTAPAASLASRALTAIKQTFGASSAPAATTPGSVAPGIRATYPAGGGAAELASVAAAGTEARTAPLWTADQLQPVASRLRGAALAAGRPDSLKAALLNVPLLAAQQADEQEEREAKKNASVSRWRWRGGYAAQRFVPNVSSLAGTGIALQRTPTMSFNNGLYAPAPEEPTKLLPGLAQRGQFGAAVPLGKKHWTLLTGAEVAVISGQTGREVAQTYTADGLRAAQEKFQTGRYHLTSVGVPVQVRYEARKQGWGVYAAVGAAVNVLLRNRTAVGTLSSTDDSPYRRVLTTARGSAGVRFSPAGGQWQLNVGPEAEAGLSTLNSNPTESWSQRTRPYAVGLSASVEFGGGRTELAP